MKGVFVNFINKIGVLVVEILFWINFFNILIFCYIIFIEILILSLEFFLMLLYYLKDVDFLIKKIIFYYNIGRVIDSWVWNIINRR